MADTNGNPASPVRSQSQAPTQPTAQAPTERAVQKEFSASVNAWSQGIPPGPGDSNIPTDPVTSASDSGTAPRPRDARTIHMILSALGVSAYQERVPLQLLDFAYRYTAGILSDAQHLSSEGYSSPTAANGKTATSADEITLDAVKLAASSRAGYQFTGGQLPKETLLEVAAERNKIRLPEVGKDGPRFGIRLPHERFLLNGRNWTMSEEWESEGASSGGEEHGDSAMTGLPNGTASGNSGGNEDEDMAEDDNAEDGEGNYKDAFGEDDQEDNEKMDEG